mmetsp:Transcript_24434/g.43879  ORF Transcript_24434/g.43879 Transcript_24434/m.43879 type:complete len:208 (-) Transcript_24434:838-1461(-)
MIILAAFFTLYPSLRRLPYEEWGGNDDDNDDIPNPYGGGPPPSRTSLYCFPTDINKEWGSHHCRSSTGAPEETTHVPRRCTAGGPRTRCTDELAWCEIGGLVRRGLNGKRAKGTIVAVVLRAKILTLTAVLLVRPFTPTAKYANEGCCADEDMGTCRTGACRTETCGTGSCSTAKTDTARLTFSRTLSHVSYDASVTTPSLQRITRH